MAALSPQEVFARVCVVLLEEDPGGWTAHGRMPVEAPLGPQPWAAVSRFSEQSLHTQVSASLPGAGGSCWAGRCRVRFVEAGAAPAVCAGPISAPSLGWAALCLFCGGGGLPLRGVRAPSRRPRWHEEGLHLLWSVFSAVSLLLMHELESGEAWG